MVDPDETTAWTIEDMPVRQQEIITRRAGQEGRTVAKFVWEAVLGDVLAVASSRPAELEAELARCHETLREIYTRVSMAIIPQRHPKLFDQMDAT